MGQKRRIFPILAVSCVCLFLVAAVAGIYWQTTGHDFISLDDPIYLIDIVQKGLTWEGVKWAFTATDSGMWFPITWLSFMLDCELYGMNPKWHHFHNLVFHALNSVLLFFALRALTQGLSPGISPDFNFWACALATALFAVHPLRVESVAWASERKDMLSGFFWWITLLLYCRYVASPGPMRYLAVFTAFVLGLMSKPMQVTLPFALLLLDYWPLGRFTWENLRRGNRKPLWSVITEKVPLFSLAVGFAVFTASLGAVEKSFPMSASLANAPVAYISYIGKTLWPVNLACLYPITGLALPWWKVTGSLALLAAMTAFTLWRAKTAPYLFTGWLWFLGTLVPVIGLVQAGPQSMADRFTYIPSLGLDIIIAWSICSPQMGRRPRAVLASVSASAVVALAVLSFFQTGLWRDSIGLYRHALALTADNYLIHNNLGQELSDKGELEEARRHIVEAIRIAPDYPLAHNNLGVLYFRLGQHLEAVPHFKKAIEYRPEYLLARENLGKSYECLGDFQQAVAVYREMIRMRKDYVPAYFRLGVAYTSLDKPLQAIPALFQVILLDPDHAGAHCYLCMNYLELGDHASAVREYRKLAALDSKMAGELFAAYPALYR